MATARELSSNLTRAHDDIRRGHETGRRQREMRQRTRLAIRAVDDLISEVEDANLVRGSKTRAAMFTAQLLDVEAAAGPAPAAARAARTTAHLHGALMDWLDDLLNDVVPERALYPECEDDAA